MTKFIARLRVVATAAPTILTGLAIAVVTIGDQIGQDWPAAPMWAGKIAVWLTAATAIIRRVMPVAKNQRGILP